MSEDNGNVIQLASHRKNSTEPTEPVPSKPAPPQRRRLMHLVAIFRKECGYGAIPEPVHSAYLNGLLNDGLFRLIYIVLTSHQDFVITRTWLERQFRDNDLAVFLDAIKKSGMVEVEQKQLRKSGRPSNIYHTTDPKHWDMSPLLAVPKARSRSKKSNNIPNTPQPEGWTGSNTLQPGGWKKSNHISKNSNPTVKGYSWKNSDSNPTVKGGLNKDLLKTPPAKLLNLDQLRSRLRLRFSKHTPGEHVRGLVDVLVEWEVRRLVARGFAEKAAKALSRVRVLDLINTVPASKQREFEESTQDEWVKMLESFPAE